MLSRAFAPFSRSASLSNAIEFVLNGTKTILRDGEFDPHAPLISYLRSTPVGLTGPKRGCDEGGCGACTVILSFADPNTGRVRHRPINACIFPLGNLHTKGITTIESLGSTATRVSEIHKAFIEHHGTQCGFCTPGFVVSTAAFLLEHPRPTYAELEGALDGNLCRCTGYRGIIEALREFTRDSRPMDSTIKTEFEGGRIGGFDLSGAEELVKGIERKELAFESNGVEFFVPCTLDGLLRLRRAHPKAAILAGNTELRFQDGKSFISTDLVPELHGIQLKDGCLEFGAATSLASILEFCRAAEPNSTLLALIERLKHFASTQVRSVASFAGNLVHSSSVSDLTNFALATSTQIRVIDAATGKERWAPSDTRPLESEVVASIRIPLARPSVYVIGFRQALRKSLAISIVSATFMVDISPDNVIRDLKIAFTGLAPRPRLAEIDLVGRQFTLANIESIFPVIDQQFPLSEEMKRGLIEFRRDLSHTFLVKFFHEVEKARGRPFDASAIEPREVEVPELAVFHGQSVKKYAGQTVSHVAAFQQTTGEAIFTDDLAVPPRTLHIALAQASVPHGRIVNIDFSPCKNLVASFTAQDLRPGINQLVSGLNEELLASETVVFQGQPVAVVVADSEEAAWEAARAVKVRYAEIPSVLSIEEAVAAKAIKLACKVEVGEFSGAIQKAVHRLRGSIRQGGQFHFYLEPNAVLVERLENGRCHVHVTSKDLEAVQSEVSRVVGINRNLIDVSVTRIGGAFCGKSQRTAPLASLAALVSSRLQRPVKIRLPREVDTHLESGDREMLSTFDVGFDDAGHITALDIDSYVDGGFSDGSVGLCWKSMAHSDSVYNIENLDIRYHVCQTNKISGAAFRGFGSQNGHIPIEAVMERVAYHLKISPEKVKRQHFYNVGDRTPLNQTLKDVAILDCWNRVDNAEFARQRRDVVAFNETHKYQKRGISTTPLKFGVGSPATLGRKGSALIHLYKDGSVRLAHGGVEFGQGMHTKMCQIVAEILDIPISAIRVDSTDLKIIANSAGTGSSMGTDMQGYAVKDAAEQLIKRLEPYRKPGLTFAEVAMAAFLDRADLTTRSWYRDPTEGFDMATMQGTAFLYYEYGAASSEVEIDVLTGTHRVRKTVICFDAGHSLNPGIDIGQIEGGFLQGYGWMTKERVLIADNSCRWAKPGTHLSDQFSSYKIPEISDVPRTFQVILLPNRHQTVGGIMSSKGIGEPPMTLANSVGFAIADAISAARRENGLHGHFNCEFPLTPDRIYRFCHKQ
jgi:xanthine dehydrogenase/oxidase